MGADLQSYLDTFRDVTDAEIALEQYEGKRYRVTWSGQLFTGGVIKPWHIVSIRRISSDGLAVVVAEQDGSYAHVSPDCLVPYIERVADLG